MIMKHTSGQDKVAAQTQDPSDSDYMQHTPQNKRSKAISRFQQTKSSLLSDSNSLFQMPR